MDYNHGTGAKLQIWEVQEWNSGFDGIDQFSQVSKATAIGKVALPTPIIGAFFYSSSPHGLWFLHRAARLHGRMLISTQK